MERKDVIFGMVDDEYDMLIRNGDLVVDNSDVQHITHIFEADQGQYRRHPLLGIGVRRMLNGSIGGAERRHIQLQLESDGYRPNQIKYEDDILKVKI
jgi:hypothetical protein